VIVRVKKYLKTLKSFIPYEELVGNDTGAAIIPEMLEYCGKEIEVKELKEKGWYESTENDWIWHRSWFTIPKKSVK